MSLTVSSSESFSPMITGDSAPLCRKAYMSPEGKGLSSTGGHDDFSNSRSLRVSSSMSSLSSKCPASLSRADSSESNTKTAKTSSSGSIVGNCPVSQLDDQVMGTKWDSFPILMLRAPKSGTSLRSALMGYPMRKLKLRSSKHGNPKRP